MITIREIVLDILLEVEKGTSYGSALIRRSQEMHPELSYEQRAFLKRLTEGCIGDEARLDCLIYLLADSKKPVKTYDPVVRCSLRMGLYEILYMDAVPDAAACDESVKLVERHSAAKDKKRLTGFTNAVLRSAVRRKEEILQEIRTSAKPELCYSMPSWILDLWKEQYGSRRAKGLAEAFEMIRPVTVRIDERTNDTERAELIENWRKNGCGVNPSAYLPYAYELTKVGDPTKLCGFSEGLFAVQDTASMLVAAAAGITGGETIVDVCSAPGGKALHCASKLALAASEQNSPKGHVFSYDLYEKKCGLIRENAERMHLKDFITVEKRDAVLYEPVEPMADIVICDLPCSGLGVLGRKREIRYRVTREDLFTLAELQRQILHKAQRYLKSGAILLYSTCTIDRTENDDVADYIEKELGMKPDPFPFEMPEIIKKSCYGTEHSRLQLFPDLHGTDGFFIARFRKP